MTYFRVDDKFWSHPKLYTVSLAARGLWVTAGSFCASYLTDGLVPKDALRFISTESKNHTARCVDELVAADLWITVDDGWMFREWTDHNYTRDQVVKQQERRRKNQEVWRTKQEMKALLKDVSERGHRL